MSSIFPRQMPFTKQQIGIGLGVSMNKQQNALKQFHQNLQNIRHHLFVQIQIINNHAICHTDKSIWNVQIQRC